MSAVYIPSFHDIQTIMMTRRTLGNSTLKVSPLCFGGNVFGWTADETTSFKLLDALTESGCNFIDTADVYSKWVPGNAGGESETIIGKWLKRRGGRDQLVIATKSGLEMPNVGVGLSRAHIERSINASLKRLQTDYIDLYISHKDDPATPFEDSLDTYARLIKAGKVRFIGASNFSAPRLAEALRTSRTQRLPAYVSLQPEYSLYKRAGYESELEALCRRENIGVTGYYSLASGFLSGKYRPGSESGDSPRAATARSYLNPRGIAILNALDAVAAEHRTNPTRIAMAWLLARPGVTSPIASATSIAQLHDLIEFAHLVLTPAQISLLDRASSGE
jgi:aryl-alcohol dehydrogenase-like predicted oxidoreductase